MAIKNRVRYASDIIRFEFYSNTENYNPKIN